MEWKELLMCLIIAATAVIIATTISQCSMKEMQLRSDNERIMIEKGLCRNGWGQWERCP